MNVTIVDDDVLENVESFDVILESPRLFIFIRLLDSRITLNPVDGVIEITDNDGMFPNRHTYEVIHNMFLFHSWCGGSGDDIVPGL